jgi:ribosome-associated heat shock protein Hsp15
MVAGAETRQETQRLDKWLVYARFCKTRSQAVGLVEAGKLRINGRKIEKPDAKLHEGDVLTLSTSAAIQLLRVLNLAERRGSPQTAHTMYEVLPENTEV